jgi:hypothetical protein
MTIQIVSRENLAGAYLQPHGEPRLDKSHLSERDVRLLLVVCTELINFCANVTGQIDPAAAASASGFRLPPLAEARAGAGVLPYAARLLPWQSPPDRHRTRQTFAPSE